MHIIRIRKQQKRRRRRQRHWEDNTLQCHFIRGLTILLWILYLCNAMHAYDDDHNIYIEFKWCIYLYLLYICIFCLPYKYSTTRKLESWLVKVHFFCYSSIKWNKEIKMLHVFLEYSLHIIYILSFSSVQFMQ